MKKQNANNKLAYKKAAITELNDQQLQDVNGASTFFCVTSIFSIFSHVMLN